MGDPDGVSGLEAIDQLVEVDQSPIGRGPRSTPATATGLFDEVRRVFALTREAKIRGYRRGRFSFNAKGGRCEACRGLGQRRLPDALPARSARDLRGVRRQAVQPPDARGAIQGQVDRRRAGDARRREPAALRRGAASARRASMRCTTSGWDT